MIAGSLMRQEALEAPARAAELLALNAGPAADVAGRLRRFAPAFAMTVARGSSDNAALYARYLFETALGLVTASAAPSVITAYGARLALARAFVPAISQSGESPDLLAAMRQAAAAGALTLALVNRPGSPLADAAGTALGLHAGPERSVAATKSFLASLVAVAQLTAVWAEDAALLAALPALPARMAAAAALDWSAGLAPLVAASQALVVARGRSFPVAMEVALKLKETGRLQGEPFSAAELRHGPLAIVGPGFPVIALATADATLGSVVGLIADLKAIGCRLLVASADPAVLAMADMPLPLPPPLHPVLDPIVAAQAFYPFLEALSVARGHDPDRPPLLSKVTKTV